MGGAASVGTGPPSAEVVSLPSSSPQARRRTSKLRAEMRMGRTYHPAGGLVTGPRNRSSEPDVEIREGVRGKAADEGREGLAHRRRALEAAGRIDGHRALDDGDETAR